MVLAVCNCGQRVLTYAGAIHWLQKEVVKAQRGEIEPVGLKTGLREDQLQLVALNLNQSSAGLWADTDPINSIRCLNGSVGLHSNFESMRVKRLEQQCVQLQQRLASGHHDKAML